ncbi:hypothetical protein R50912_03965 [Paenibacillus sp. FSL R5-0912]|nr:hypothetical protein R50912_03965 [Paenibacillus sp. FSL R5-0912]
MKKKNSDNSELAQLTREIRKLQFYYNMLSGLSASCGALIPLDSVYTLIRELSDQEANLRKKAKDHSVKQ